MEFTETELLLIKNASSKIKQNTVVRVFFVLILILAIPAMLSGHLDGEHFMFLAIFMVVISIAQPQLGTGPKYEDLVGLLASKCSSKDPIIEMLKSKYN